MDNSSQEATPAEHTISLNSNSDAEFPRRQKLGGGVVIALYVITAAGYLQLGSTMSGKTLEALNLKIPDTPTPKSR